MGWIPTKETRERLRKARKISHKINCRCCYCKAKRGETKGVNAPHYGKKRTEKTREKIGKGNKGKVVSIETRERMSKSHKGMLGKHHSKSSRDKISEAKKKQWKDADFIAKQMLARNVYPNKSEKLLTKLLHQLLPNEWKYVGNGQFILAGKCPDFVNVNGQKKIIELYGDYWHEPEEEEKRTNLFAKYGYQTLIIWEHELDDLESLSEKLLNFNS